MLKLLLITLVVCAFAQEKVLVYKYKDQCNVPVEEAIEMYDNGACFPTTSLHYHGKYTCNSTHATFGLYDSGCKNLVRADSYPLNSCQVGNKYVCGSEPRMGPQGYVQKFYLGFASCKSTSTKPLYSFLYHAGCLTGDVGESSRKFLSNGNIVHEQYSAPRCSGSPYSVKRYAIDECKEHWLPFTFKYQKQ